MMKRTLIIIAGVAALGIGMMSCGGAHGSDPGDAYMPDMYYSTAYDAYGYNTTDKKYEELKRRGIHYDGLPVAGTMARGDVPTYPLPANDSGYALAVNYRNPDTARLNQTQRKEAERIYQINCAICHGTQLDGNGPLWKGGDGPFPAAPRNLKDDYSKKLADGQMYHVIMYGKGQMGSYASQVHPEQRWWIIKYIREKQGGGAPATAGGSATDSTMVGGVATANGSDAATGSKDGATGGNNMPASKK